MGGREACGDGSLCGVWLCIARLPPQGVSKSGSGWQYLFRAIRCQH